MDESFNEFNAFIMTGFEREFNFSAHEIRRSIPAVSPEDTYISARVLYVVLISDSISTAYSNISRASAV